MALSDKELKEIAYLARINIKEDSFSSLKKELEQILELFEELNEADTSEVTAMSHPLDLSQPTRKDEVTEEDQREELLKNAPSVQSGLFLVPKVIEGEV
jgi:aspartyl-tRNA(Asn)/glutamyl-tRNA(Gln) amidotransferase subunit C